jgi:ribosomal protein S18 acetylase RimI-like enzyme
LISFRRAAASDLPFLVALRVATMSAHLEAAGESLTSEDQVARVLADFDCIELVLRDGEPIGMIKVLRAPEGWRLVQIQLAAEHQGGGIGGRIIADLLADARRADVPVVLSVLKVNPARRLYERLGFRVVAEKDASWEMRAEVEVTEEAG